MDWSITAEVINHPPLNCADQYSFIHYILCNANVSDRMNHLQFRMNGSLISLCQKFLPSFPHYCSIYLPGRQKEEDLWQSELILYHHHPLIYRTLIRHQWLALTVTWRGADLHKWWIRPTCAISYPVERKQHLLFRSTHNLSSKVVGSTQKQPQFANTHTFHHFIRIIQRYQYSCISSKQPHFRGYDLRFHFQILGMKISPLSHFLTQEKSHILEGFE